MSETPPTPERMRVDELIDVVAEGAEANGAKEYVRKYIQGGKQSVFTMLVNCQPSEQNLLRVWAFAVGLDTIEKDLAEAISNGAEAREKLTEAPGLPGQAEGE